MNDKKSIKILAKASKETSANNYLKAIALCKKSIGVSSKNHLAYQLLATNLTQLKRFKEAEVVLKKAITLSPDSESEKLIHLLGCNYTERGRYLQSLDTLETLFNRTGNIKILIDIGLCFHQMGDFRAARDVYFKLIELDPDNINAKFHLFAILVFFKEFKMAWTFFHSRLQLPEIKDKINWYYPAWMGQRLAGKRVLISSEQGIGDNLFYTSCFSEAVAEAEHCYILCDARLVSLYQYNFPNATVLSEVEKEKLRGIVKFADFQILAGSLSYLYRSSINDFSQQKKLLIPNELITNKNSRLSNKKLRIGLSWFHGRVNENCEYSMLLEELLPLFKIANVEWVNLQFGDWEKEACTLKNRHGVELKHWSDCCPTGDFIEYGSLICNLDLVIAPSNASFMYAARLGIKTWIFVPRPDYAIDEDGASSLWYDNVQQFCQYEEESWDNIIEKMRREIILLVEKI